MKGRYVFPMIFAGLFFFTGLLGGQQAVQKKVKLGPQVNSAAREILPMVSADGRILYFTREYFVDDEVREKALAKLTKGMDEPTRTQMLPILKSSMADESLLSWTHQTIWYSEKQVDGTWGPAVKMAPPLNNDFATWICSVPDGNTLLVGGRFGAAAKEQEYDFKRALEEIAKAAQKAAENGADPLTMMQAARGTPGQAAAKPGPAALTALIVATSVRGGGKWGEPHYLAIEGFATSSNRNDFYLAPGNRVLILSITNADGPGGRDLFASFRRDDGTWTRPKSLGVQVNSAQDEISPFVAADGATLYFTSNREGGQGGYDIYVTRRQDDSWLKWSAAEELGPELNTAADEANLTVDGQGRYAFLSAGRTGAEDIYVFELAPAMRPMPVAIIHGCAHDPQDKPVAATVTYERLRDGVGAGEANCDRLSGQYRAGLSIGHVYGFRAEAAGYLPVSDRIDLVKAKPGEEFRRDLLLVPIKPGATIRLNNLFFEFAKTTLLPESGVELKRLAQILHRYPKMEIEIAGHTDNIGDDPSNQALSEGRAAAVLKYLQERGIDAGRMRARGYGESLPVAPNDSDEHRQLNRRVELRILRME